MPFDPTFPADHSDLNGAPYREQFNSLKALIDAQATRIAALEAALSSRAAKPTMGEFDPGFADPPTTQDLQNIQTVINDLIVQLESN